MLKPTFSKQRPTRAGYYLAWEDYYKSKPELVEVGYTGKKLWYFSQTRSEPLSLIDRDVLFSEAISLKDRP